MQDISCTDANNKDKQFYIYYMEILIIILFMYMLCYILSRYNNNNYILMFCVKSVWSQWCFENVFNSLTAQFVILYLYLFNFKIVLF